MTLAVLLSDSAKDILRQLPPQTRRRLKAALVQLGRDPTGRRGALDVRQLKVPARTPATHRLAVGAFRLAFRIQDGNVYVVRIFHRSFGYAWLE